MRAPFRFLFHLLALIGQPTRRLFVLTWLGLPGYIHLYSADHASAQVSNVSCSCQVFSPFFCRFLRCLKSSPVAALPWPQLGPRNAPALGPVSVPAAWPPVDYLSGQVGGVQPQYPGKWRKCPPGRAYKHQCYKCEGSHPVSNCNFRGQNKQSSCHPSTAKSQSSHPANTRKS